MTEELRFQATDSTGEVSALLTRSADARALVVLGHGAGAGMRHAFLEDLRPRWARRGLATFCYQFPYMEAGRKLPNHAPILEKTVRSAVAAAAATAPELPLFAGGKSLGGRMTARAQAKEPLPGVRGLVFLGFPLHPAKKPGTERAAHLFDVAVPMLFLQGTRDKLADLDLLRPICADLGDRATLREIDGADHGFAVLKRSGRTADDVAKELADAAAEWAGRG